MDPLTQLLLTSTLAALVGFLVLVFPLLFLFAAILGLAGLGYLVASGAAGSDYPRVSLDSGRIRPKGDFYRSAVPEPPSLKPRPSPGTRTRPTSVFAPSTKERASREVISIKPEPPLNRLRPVQPRPAIACSKPDFSWNTLSCAHPQVAP